MFVYINDSQRRIFMKSQNVHMHTTNMKIWFLLFTGWTLQILMTPRCLFVHVVSVMTSAACRRRWQHFKLTCSLFTIKTGGVISEFLSHVTWWTSRYSPLWWNCRPSGRWVTAGLTHVSPEDDPRQAETCSKCRCRRNSCLLASHFSVLTSLSTLKS